jgi:hypothetical protein
MRRPNTEPLIDVIEAGNLTGLYPGTIRAAARRGELAHVRQRNTRKILFTREALGSWLIDHFEGVTLADDGERK